MSTEFVDAQTIHLTILASCYILHTRSMGFMQWPILYGKLQRLIQRAPQAFRRCGIELEGSYKFKKRRKKKGGGYYWDKWTEIGIKGAKNPSDLRNLEWAKRFYAAGLDPDIIVEEVKLAFEVIEESKKRIVRRVGTDFLPYYKKSAVLRALIQETFNNRPAYLYVALRRAIARAKKMGEVSTDQFLEMVRKAIKEVYKQKESESGLKKAKRLIYKTARLVL